MFLPPLGLSGANATGSVFSATVGSSERFDTRRIGDEIHFPGCGTGISSLEDGDSDPATFTGIPTAPRLFAMTASRAPTAPARVFNRARRLPSIFAWSNDGSGETKGDNDEVEDVVVRGATFSCLIGSW